MSISKTANEALVYWAKLEREKLPKNILVLISLAKQDLYYGPLSQEDAVAMNDGDPIEWHGFESSVEMIKKSLENIHVDDVWVDIQVGEVLLVEQKGFMGENPDYDPNDPESEEKIWCEPNWEDIYHVSSHQVKEAILGNKELASYF